MVRVDQEHYFQIRQGLADDLNQIIDAEQKYMAELVHAIALVAEKISDDFNKASQLIPFWINYPPLQRGRSPRGDSVPWLEVGEKVIAPHIIRVLDSLSSDVTYPGLPSGSDIRFMTNNALVHLDIKITGPNDRVDEIVASPNQLSGDGGKWENGGIINSAVVIEGQRQTMVFQPELSPFYYLDDDTLICLTYFLKGVYEVEELGRQPLDSLELICVPNGLLAFTGHDYNKTTPGLFIPGKDEKAHRKKRVRVRMQPLSLIGNWRRHKIWQRNT